MKILVVIPARGGSKRIPRKNIRMIGGKPLILYSVENAKNLKNNYDTDIVVSTDDEELESIVSKQESVFVIQRNFPSSDIEHDVVQDRCAINPQIKANSKAP